MQKKNIYIIVPVFNEQETIRDVTNSLLQMQYSILIVDDGSADGTKECLNDLPVFYLKHKVNLGQGAALQTGINFALRTNAEYFVTFDADGQHDASDINGMIRKMDETGSDVVFGSRFLEGSKTNISASRSLILNLARYINYALSGILLSDAHNGLRVFNRKAASELYLTENKMAHATQIQILVAQKKLTYCEYPTNIHYNEYTKRKGSKNIDGIKILFEILLAKIFNS